MIELPRLPRGRLTVAGAFCVYSALSLLFFSVPSSWKSFCFAGGSDSFSFIWFLNWWPWAILHNVNPFISRFVWFPAGFNMAWATAVPTLALLLSPLTLAANAAVSFNVLMLLSPAISAWCAFLLMRFITKDNAAALVGGFLYGFSAYALRQLLGHLNLCLVFLPPLMLLLVVERLAGAISRRHFLVLLALCGVVQFGISAEVFATSAFFGAATWLVFLAFGSPEHRVLLWQLAVDVALSTAATAIMLLPYLYYMWVGAAATPAILYSPIQFSADLANFVIPTPNTWVGGDWFRNVTTALRHGNFEQASYLGPFLIAIIALYIREPRPTAPRRPLLFAMLVAAIASLGPRLWICGRNTGVPLPWAVFTYFPLIRHALPVRFSLYTSLAAAVIAALWMANASSRRGRVGRLVMGACACLTLLPAREAYPWVRLPTLPFFQPQHVEKVLGRQANVLMLPYGYTGPSMIWQWQSGMRMTQSGGYLTFTPPAFLKLPVVQALYHGSPGRGFASDLAAFCAINRVKAVLAGPGTPPKLLVALQALEWQRQESGGVAVFFVPAVRTLHYHYVAGDYWPRDRAWSWMGSRVTIVTHDQRLWLKISGMWRPVALGGVDISVASGATVSHYHIQQQTTQWIPLPPDASTTLTADRTFVPQRLEHNGDLRPLSVLIQLRTSNPVPKSSKAVH